MTATDAAADALRRGWTLPASWYTDPARHAIEQRAIFERSWQYVAHTRELARPGDFVTTSIGTVPVVVTRGPEGRLYGLINVCRHRAHEVASGAGNRMTLQCPYHGWTYDLDGRLRQAPRSDAEACFERGELSLLPVRLEVWEPFVFATLDAEAAPLARTLGEIPARMAAYGFDFAALEHRRRIEYRLEANWKVYVENSLECYHCPVAHPGLTRAVEMAPEVYRLRADGLVMTHESRLRHGAGEARPVLESQPGVPEFQFSYHWPALMLAPSPGRLWLGTFRPLDVRTTLVVADFFFEPGLPQAKVDESVAFSDVVLTEDRNLVESVQRGLESGRVPYGRLLPESEQLLRHFQALVVEAGDRHRHGT